MSQCQLILRHLQQGHTLTVAEALQSLGIYALSQRVTDLRNQGYPIITNMIITQSGKRIARYKMGVQLELEL